ncbi:MAG: protein kinase domain-containing protein, partial [bacterium]
MNQLHCPEQNALSDFLWGKLPEREQDLIAEHLEVCHQCEQTAQALETAADPLVQSLEFPFEEDVLEESELHHALGEMRKMARQDTAAGGKSATTIQPGTQIGVYEIIQPLAAGGMGRVYEALHTQLDRRMAFKVIHPCYAADSGAIARFRREIKALGQLSHPNLVQAFDAGEADGLLYLAMELVSGKDLRQISSECGRMPVTEACEVIRQAASALEYAHQQNIIHRDVKPSNLMLTSEGCVKVLDLGLARMVAGPTQTELINSGQCLGTIDYMALEQVEESHQVDHRADIFSLGATLHKLLTGRAPLEGEKYETPLKKALALTQVTLPSIGDLRPDLPIELVRVVDAMLARDPSDRISTAREVEQLVGKFTENADLPSLMRKPGGFSERLGTAATAVHPCPESAAEQRNLGETRPVSSQPNRARSRLSKTAVVALSFAVVGVTAACGLWLAGDGANPFRSAGPNRASASATNAQGTPLGPSENRSDGGEAATTHSGTDRDTSSDERSEANPFTTTSNDEQASRAGFPLAVLPFQDPSQLELSEELTAAVNARLLTDPRFFVVERAELNDVLEEQELTLSGAARPDQAIQIGQLTGAQLLVTGSISQIDETLLLVGKVIGTETSRSVGARVTGKTSDDLAVLAEDLADQLADRIHDRGQTLVPPQQREAKTIELLKERL